MRKLVDEKASKGNNEQNAQHDLGGECEAIASDESRVDERRARRRVHERRPLAVEDRLRFVEVRQIVCQLSIGLRLPVEVIGQIDQGAHGIHKGHEAQRREDREQALEELHVEVGQPVAYDEYLEQLADEVERGGHVVVEHAAMDARVCGEEEGGDEVASREAGERRAEYEADERVVERVDDDEAVEGDTVDRLIDGQESKAEQIEEKADEGERRDDEQVERVHEPSRAEADKQRLAQIRMQYRIYLVAQPICHERYYFFAFVYYLFIVLDFIRCHNCEN